MQGVDGEILTRAAAERLAREGFGRHAVIVRHRRRGGEIDIRARLEREILPRGDRPAHGFAEGGGGIERDNAGAGRADGSGRREREIAHRGL